MDMPAVRRLPVLAIVSLFFFSCEGQDPCKFLYGSWEVYKAIDIDDVAFFPQEAPKAREKYLTSDEYKSVIRFSEDLANYMLGKQIKFAKTYVGINGIKAKYPVYEITDEQPDRYLYVSHRIGDKRDLGINDEVNKIQVIRLRLSDKQLKSMEDVKNLRGKSLQIPCPNCPATFYIENLIIYNNEIILPFSILKPGKDAYNHSWQKYLCLRKVK